MQVCCRDISALPPPPCSCPDSLCNELERRTSPGHNHQCFHSHVKAWGGRCRSQTAQLRGQRDQKSPTEPTHHGSLRARVLELAALLVEVVVGPRGLGNLLHDEFRLHVLLGASVDGDMSPLTREKAGAGVRVRLQNAPCCSDRSRPSSRSSQGKEKGPGEKEGSPAALR